MINITKLYCGLSQPADALRYGQSHAAPRSAAERRPVVVWNITRRCNLRCIHCYSDSDGREYPGELTWDQCCGVVDDLAQFGVPGVLLSGGEPLIHPRFFDLAGYARGKGLRLTLSTNGTLIDCDAAQRLKELGFAYVLGQLTVFRQFGDVTCGESKQNSPTFFDAFKIQRWLSVCRFRRLVAWFKAR